MGDACGPSAEGKTCGEKIMSPEGFEPPTFGSGIRRAAVAPWVRGAAEPGNCRAPLAGRLILKKLVAAHKKV